MAYKYTYQDKNRINNDFQTQIDALKSLSDRRDQHDAIMGKKMIASLGKINADLKNINDLSARIKPKIDELNNKIAQANTHIQAQQDEINKLKQTNAGLGQTIERLTQEKTDCETARKQLQHELELAKAEIDLISQEITRLRNIENENVTLKRDNDRFQNENNGLKSGHDNLEKLNGDLQRDNTTLKSDMERLQALMEKQKQEHEGLTKHIEELEAQIAQIFGEKNELAVTISKLENQSYIDRIVNATKIMQAIVNKFNRLDADSPEIEGEIDRAIKLATGSIQAISSALQGSISGGKKKYKKNKTKKYKKYKKYKKQKGGFIYGTS